MREDYDEPASDEDAVPEIQIRVPGPWESPEELEEGLKRSRTGWRMDMSDGGLVHDATRRRVEGGNSPHDDDLAGIFRSGHGGRMSKKELNLIKEHATKIHVSSPGGSEESARVAVDAAAALIRAGGTGVFVDNSGACHGPRDFLKLAGDKDPGGLYWIFVTLTSGPDGIWSTGMQCLGLRDCRLVDPPDDKNIAAFAIHNFLGYTYQSGAIVCDGDVLNGPDGPLFRVFHEPCTTLPAGSPMHNPYGMWRLEAVIPGTMGGGQPPM
jgi:hypothetical protein